MLTVHKYGVPVEDRFTLDLPDKAKVLTFQIQRSRPYIWVLIDTAAESKPRRFRLVGTGHMMLHSEIGRYVGSVQLQSGALVFHLFEAE